MARTTAKSDHVAALVIDLVPRPMIFPGEDPVGYEDLRAALLSDLAPHTPYARMLAENLVRLEWEAQRHQRMRDDLIRAEARNVAIGVIATGEAGSNYFATFDQQALGFDLFGSDPEKAAAAKAIIDRRQITMGEIFAKAYSLVSGQVELHERKLANIETRRRRLREDYDRLKTVRSRPIEDAEVLP